MVFVKAIMAKPLTVEYNPNHIAVGEIRESEEQ